MVELIVRVHRDPNSARLRAYLYVNEQLFAVWPITATDGTRYKGPLKPAPPAAQALLNRLPTSELERLIFFLWTAEDGDEIRFHMS